MQTSTRTRSARLLAPFAVATLLGVAACSSDDEGAADDVATLGAGDETSDGATDDDGGGGGEGGRQIDPEFQDAILEFAECMREHGVDMPDPQIQDGGGVVIAGPAIAVEGGGPGGPPSDGQLEELEAAQEACQPIMDAVEDSMPQPDPEQIQEMQDQALEFAQCMREHGVDMPDPQFGEGGRMTQVIGEPGAGGIDPSDDDFQAASEECGGEGGFGITVSGGAAGSSAGFDAADPADGEDG